MNTRIAILLPCYNEALTITKTIADFRAALPTATVYVFDNASTDNSAELASKSGAVVIPVQQRGKGNVVRTMFREVNADVYLMADADDTYPADEAEKAYREKKLISSLKSMLGIAVEVHLVAPKSVPRSEGKAVRIVDNRKLFEESRLIKK